MPAKSDTLPSGFALDTPNSIRADEDMFRLAKGNAPVARTPFGDDVANLALARDIRGQSGHALGTAPARGGRLNTVLGGDESRVVALIAGPARTAGTVSEDIATASCPRSQKHSGILRQACRTTRRTKGQRRSRKINFSDILFKENAS